MQGTTLTGILALLILALAGLLWAERRGSRAMMWATKPIASAAFVALGIADGAPATTTGRLLVLALILSFAGDLLLIPLDPRIFRAGILIFLLAHVAFLGAFAAAGIAWGWLFVALALLALAAWVIARRILPHVSADLRPAVIAYMIVITLMVAGAAGASAAGASPLLLLAALMFWTNDLLVARDRFLAKNWLNRAIGLPLYYGAMVLFALSVA